MRRPLLLALTLALLALPVQADGERLPNAADTRAVLQALSIASEAERPAWRWRLARDYAAAGLYAEADGVLRVIAADTPARAETPGFRLLHAEVLTAVGDPEAALALLDSPVMEGLPAACLQRLAAATRMQRHAEVPLHHRCAAPAIAALPPQARTPYLMAAVRSYVALGAFDAADALLRPMALSASEKGEAAYWQGVIARARSQPALALGHFKAAMASPNPIAALRGEVAAIDLRVENGSLTRKAALARLDRLGHVWRGGAAERDLRMAEGRLREAEGDVHGAFAAYSVAANYFPEGAELRDQLSARFEAIFADGGTSLPPVQAFALFWDFRDFAPQGPAADAMVRRLADRLTGLGMEAQAASLLEHQVYNRLEGTAQASVAVSLAGLLVDSGQPARALAVLGATSAATLPDDLARQRTLVEASALIGTGRTSEARALLADIGGARAETLRAEAAWTSRDWAGVIAHLEPLLPSTGAQDPAVLAVLLRVTVAAAMEGDDALLRRLRQRYSADLQSTELAGAFEALTGDPAALDPAALRRALALAAEKASGYRLTGGKAA